MFKQLALASVLVTMVGSSAIAAQLSPDAKEAVLLALDDEYHAEAVYKATMDKFGNVRPFSNIIRAEQKHASMMKDILIQYGVTVPSNPYLNGEKPLPDLPDTLAEVCKIGVEAELVNRDLYDKQLLPKVTGYPAITVAFEALRDASEYRHLPAFQRCASRRS